MKFCMECGEKLEDGQKFCPICGTKVPDEMISQAVQQPEQASRETIAENKPKKGNKIGVIIAICAGVLAIGAAVLVLFLTGVFKKCAPDREQILAPSKDKLIAIADRTMTDIWDRTKAAYQECGELSFDADITVEAKTGDDVMGSMDISEILNNAKLQVRADNTNGRNLGVMLSLWGNPVLDLRLFDLNQKTISFYCSPGSDKLYVVSLDVLLKNMTQGQETGISVDSVLDLLFSEPSEDKLRSDYDALKKAITDTIGECDVDIETEQKIGLFNGDTKVECEVYTIHPTKEQIEACLNRLFDIVESENGYIAQIIRITNVSADELKESREQIPEAAQEIYDSNLEIVVAVVGNDIVRLTVNNDSFDFVLDALETEAENRVTMQATVDEEAYTVDLRKDAKGQLSVQANFGDRAAFSGSCDTNRKSLIGTYAGHFDLFVDDEKTASLDVAPSETGMLHTITVYADAIEMGFEDDMKVSIDVKPATGVQRPSGAETVDISNYTPEQLSQLLQKLIAPLILIMQMQSYYGY